MNRLFLLVFTIVISSCQTKEREEIDNSNPAKINLGSIQKFSGNSNIKNIEYIPLETNDNCLVGDISKMFFNHNKFHLWERELNSIFIFNRDGSFHNKLSRLGKGPGEYLHIFDFAVNDEDNSIWVYDSHSSKMIIYDETLANFREFKLDNRFEEFAIKGHDTIYVRNLYSEGRVYERLAELNISNNRYKSIYNTSAYDDDFNLVRLGGSMLHRSNDKLIFNPRFKNTIIQIQEGEISKVYEVVDDFPDKSAIEEYRRDPASVRNKGKYVLGIYNIYEIAGTFTFSFEKRAYPLSEVFISKKSNKCFTIDYYNEDKHFGGNPVIYGVAENKFISTAYPSINLDKPEYRKKIENSPLDEKNKSILLNAKEADNPIIVLYDLVDF